jgi:hypothetical protein
LIANATRRAVIASGGRIANTLGSRFRGLMLHNDLAPGSGLVIDPCTSIHMFFMRFSIDVLYVDRNDHVVRIQEGLKPWRVGPLYTKGARYVIELPEGTIARTGTQVGDSIRIDLPS